MTLWLVLAGFGEAEQEATKVGLLVTQAPSRQVSLEVHTVFCWPAVDGTQDELVVPGFIQVLVV